MSLPTRTVASLLQRLHRRFSGLLERSPPRTDGGMLLAEDDHGREESDHLRDVSDGAGCTEIWEHLSEQREEEERDDEP
ncbi:MAG: hypothetical protein ABEH64_02410 [Salinirussus sp.]